MQDNPHTGSSTGAAYLVLGSATVASASLADADARFVGEDGLSYTGSSVAGAGDVDGDGHADILIGAYLYDDPTAGASAGAAYLVLGPPPAATTVLTDANARFVGANADDQAGASVAGAGDVNADGTDEFLVSVPGYDDPSVGSDAGAAYLVLGTGL